MTSSGTLPLETDKRLAKCPKLRVLVVGKSGAGKSSLINHVFGIKQQVTVVSHNAPGICNIEDEITSPDNRHLVLHDSMGFEPGQDANLKKAINFLRARSAENVAIQDQVHVVWLCIKIPHAGGRVLETGDEEFIQFALDKNVPLIVVFTQFDKLQTRIEQELTEAEMELSDCEAIVAQRSEKKFVEICDIPLRKSQPLLPYVRTSVGICMDEGALKSLVHTTRDKVENRVWFVTTVAQRRSPRDKVDGSIDIGMQGYWRGLASTTKLFGSTLENCLRTIHFEITASWNFNDPDEFLASEAFKQRIYSLIQFLVPEDKEIRSWFDDVDRFQTLIGIGTTITAAAGPVLVAIGLSKMFVEWIASRYVQTPEALRCLMAYICDLTLIMDHLFLETLDLPPPRHLTQAHIDSAVESYQKSSAWKVHNELRMYANSMTFAQIVQSNRAEEKVQEIIDLYCSK